MLLRFVNLILGLAIVIGIGLAARNLQRQIDGQVAVDQAEEDRIARLTVANARAADAAINKRWRQRVEVVDDFENTEWW